jgi:hypothetical protein
LVKKEETMRKLALCIALAFVLVMGASSTGLAGVGVAIDKVSFCNDLWLDVDQVVANQVYAITGIEAGTCPSNDAVFTGTVRLAGGTAYFGVVGSYGAIGDGAALKSDNFTIAFSNNQGMGSYYYFYASGGAATVFGASGLSYVMSFSGPPQAGAEGEALESNDGPAE